MCVPNFFKCKKNPAKNDNSNKEIQEKLEALRNLNLVDPGSLTAKEFHQIIKAQMELMIALFERQHNDTKKLSNSSNRLEILTVALIIIGAVLIIPTLERIIPILAKILPI